MNENRQAIWNKPSGRVVSAQELLPTVLNSRNLKGKELESFLQPDYSQDLADPFLLSNMQAAVDRITQAIKAQEKIIIYGDYDIDGLTASTLLYDVLHACNPGVEAYIPDRFEEGYGLNSAALKKLHKEDAKLIITVDCGITAVKEIASAAKLGLDVVVTDHHTVPQKLPNKAIALINPKLPGDKYPYKDLAGVGVAFALVRALQQADPGILKPGQEKWLLDLVALGTVCDVVPLTQENRTMVHFGLQVLRRSRRAGLQALASVSATELNQVRSEDLGFRFGPRLNAAGRLEHAKKSLQLLTATNYSEALGYAQILDQLNAQRQQLTTDIFTTADLLAKKYEADSVLVLASEDWSHGVAGLVASKISEKWHKPTIILQVSGDTAKGSARSYGTCNIIEAITATESYLTRFGGHQFAAGMTLPSKNIDTFRKNLNDYIRSNYSSKDFARILDIDAVLDDVILELPSLDRLTKLEPYGNNNPEPLFCSQLILQESHFVGQTKAHTKFRFRTQNRRLVDGISFYSAHKWPDGVPPGSVEVVYRLQDNTWQNVRSLQLEVVDLKTT